MIWNKRFFFINFYFSFVFECYFLSAAPVSISMVDPVIDEHFRRSLGADYMNLFGKKHETTAKHTSTEQGQLSHPNQLKSANESSQSSTPSPNSSNKSTISLSPKPSQLQNASPPGIDVVDGKGTSNTIAMSVDDHFAKALGDTWKQLQQAEKQIAASNSGQSDVDDDDDDDFDDDMGAYDDENSWSSSTSTSIQRNKHKSRKIK